MRPLTVLTLVYDPMGDARSLFGRCAASVKAQVGADLNWVVSVQQAHSSYDDLLDEISAESGSSVVHRSDAASLSEHLSVALADLIDQPVHILCQDDRYTTAHSAACVVAALAHRKLVYIEPRLATGHASGRAPVERDTRRRPRLRSLGGRRSFVARAGINRMGGLSTIAYVAGFSLGHPLEYELMVDLELRERLEERFGEPGLLTGGVVTEAVWSGQSQNSLGVRAEEEAHAWVRAHGRSPLGRFGSAVIAGAMRQRELAEAWAGSDSGFPIVAGRLLAPGGDAARLLWRRRRS